MLKVHHAGIVVRDMEKMLHFWVDTMGCKLEADFEFANDFLDAVQNLGSVVNLRIVKVVDKDGFIVELLEYKSHPAPIQKNNQLCNCGIRHIAFTVDSVDEYYNRLIANGYQALSKPEYSEELAMKLFFVRDPEDNLVEFIELM